MQPIYRINEDFITNLHDRTHRALDAAASEWNHDFRRELFLYEVLATQIRPAITKELVECFIETCLSASLEREEGKFNNFSIVLEPPDPIFTLEQFVFRSPLPFNATSIKKLSPAINPAKYQIGVWLSGEGKPQIWGYRPNIVWFLSLNSISPGKISYSCLSNELTSFKCLISLSQTGIINPLSPTINPIRNWISENPSFTALQKTLDLNSIFARMFQIGEGGAVLLIKGSEWKNSLRQPILYELNNPESRYQFPQIIRKYDVFRDIERKAKLNIDIPEDAKPGFRDKLGLSVNEARLALENIANLTRVDGATIIDESLTVFAFGAKIRTEAEGIHEILVREPFGGELAEIPVAEIGGTRHQSAALFVYNQRTSVAVVVSEDRRISIFSWDDERQAVIQLKNFEFLILG